MELSIELLQLSTLRGSHAIPQPTAAQLAAAKAARSLQPLVVRSIPLTGYYEILQGATQWVMAQQLRIPVIDVELRNDLNDTQAKQLVMAEMPALLEKNPIQRAKTLLEQKTREGISVAELARRNNKSRSVMLHQLRLLTLPRQIQNWVSRGQLLPGHVRTLVTIEDPLSAIELAEIMLDDGLTAREAEALVKQHRNSTGNDNRPTKTSKPSKDKDTINAETLLREAIGWPTEINHLQPHGKIEINYTSLEDLEYLMDKLLSLSGK